MNELCRRMEKEREVISNVIGCCGEIRAKVLGNMLTPRRCSTS